MITLFDLWEKFCGEYNTHQGGHVRPHRNFTNWVNNISISLFEEKFTGAWEKNQKIIDDLGKPFLRSTPAQSTAGGPTYDIVSFPGDYAHFSAARYFHKEGTFDSCDGCKVEIKSPAGEDDYKYETYVAGDGSIEQQIEMVKSDKWGSLMKHLVKRPKPTKPKMTQYDGGFKLAPKGIGTIYIDYLRKPKVATFLYTLGVGDQIIYNPASQPLEWSELVINEFLQALGLKYGKFIRESFIYQTSDKEKTTNV